MRLLIVGTLKGQLTTATKIAMDNGASVTHAEGNEQAMNVLRGGKGADLLMVDVALDIRDLVMRLEAEHIHVPIVACGITNDARAAVAAIHAGAKEYIPLPPDAELIAAVLAAVAEESSAFIFNDPNLKAVLKLADQVAPALLPLPPRAVTFRAPETDALAFRLFRTGITWADRPTPERIAEEARRGTTVVWAFREGATDAVAAPAPLVRAWLIVNTREVTDQVNARAGRKTGLRVFVAGPHS